MTLQIFSLMLHGPFAPHNTEYSNPHKVQLFLEGGNFVMPLIADWKKIGEHQQCQMHCNTACENKTCADCDYTVGDNVLLRKDGILHKTESKYDSDPWTITSVHMNGTIRVQHGTKSERLVNYVMT